MKNQKLTSVLFSFGGLVLLGGLFGALAQQEFKIATDAFSAIQKIKTTFFVEKNVEGLDTYQRVKVEHNALEGGVMNVGLCTSADCDQERLKNEVVKGGSALGGRGNKNQIISSLVVGGKNNTLSAGTNSLIGGSDNVSMNGGNAVALGSRDTQINNSNAIAVGVQESTLLGSNVVALGVSEATVSQNNVFVIGKDIAVNNQGVFAFNAKNQKLTAEKDHTFLINADRGLIINTDTPASDARVALTIKGTLKPGYETKSSDKSGSLINKTCKSGGEIYSCVCAYGQEATPKSVSSAPVCEKVCETSFTNNANCPTISPVCGAKAGEFPAAAVIWPHDAKYCDIGSPSVMPKFPGVGETVTWNCLGTSGASKECTATRLEKSDPVIPTPTPINGQCSTQLNTCTSGTFVDIADSSTHYLWRCEGIDGGINAPTCQRAIPQNAQCSSSYHNTNQSTLSASPALCTVGTVANFKTNSDPLVYTQKWTWDCVGETSYVDSCFAHKPAPDAGVCDTDTLFKCKVPTSKQEDGINQTTITGGATWNCEGTNGGATVACNACYSNYTWNNATKTCEPNKRSNQSCTALPSNATWNTVSSITQTWNGSAWLPTTVGVYNATPSTTECRFKCNANYTWNGSSCIAVSNGVCGSADKTVVGSIPSGVSACNPGTRSAVTTTTTNYTWTCAGINGGTTSSTCTACRTGYAWNGSSCQTVANGVCGSADKTVVGSIPSGVSACNAGTRSTVTTTTANYTWTCAGINGGTTSSTCTACRTGYSWNGSSCVAVSNGVCGTADKTTVSSVPTGNPIACNPGTRSTVTTTASNYTWTCAGTNGGTTSSTCTACRTGYSWNGSSCVAVSNGVCGSADKTVVGSIPSGTSACNPGTRSPVTTATSNYTWTCAGTNGGTTSSTCTACRTGYTWDGNNCVAEEVGICNTINIQVGVTNLDTLSDSAFCKKGVPLKNWSSSWYIWAKTATWKCRLSGGQDSDLCSVTCPAGSELNRGMCRDAKCGTTPLSCALGTLGLDFSTDDDYQWSCMGASGSEQRCQEQRNLVNGKCSPTLYTCEKGTVENKQIIGTNAHWECAGNNGGKTDSCMVQHQKSCKGTYNSSDLVWQLMDGVSKDFDEYGYQYMQGTIECTGFKPGYGANNLFQAGCGTDRSSEKAQGYKPYYDRPVKPLYDPGVLGQKSDILTITWIAKRCPSASCNFGNDWLWESSNIWWEAVLKPGVTSCLGLSESVCMSKSNCIWDY